MGIPKNDGNLWGIYEMMPLMDDLDIFIYYYNDWIFLNLF